jgi:hypothetical protein
LEVASGTKTDRWGAFCVHGVGGIILLMHLAVCTKRGFLIFVVVKAMAGDEFSGAKLSGDSSGQREVVEPHDNKVNKLYEHEGWKTLEW